MESQETMNKFSWNKAIPLAEMYQDNWTMNIRELGGWSVALGVGEQRGGGGTILSDLQAMEVGNS